MAEEEYRPPLREFLDMLADLLAEKYFERVDERVKKIPELRRLITAKEAGQYPRASQRIRSTGWLLRKSFLTSKSGIGFSSM